MFRFWLRSERSWKVENRDRNFTPDIWKVLDKLCKMKPFWSQWQHQWRHNMTLNIALFMFKSGWLWGQVLRSLYWETMCNHISRFHIDKEYLTMYNFSRSQVKGQSHRVSGVPGWHKTNVSGILMGMLLGKPRFGFTFGFHDHRWQQLRAILYGCQIER